MAEPRSDAARSTSSTQGAQPAQPSQQWRLYAVLGLERDRNASPAELRAQFRRLARVRHPDKNPAQENAHRAFQELNEAYDILRDPQQRLLYDALGDKAFFEMKNGSGSVTPALSLNHTIFVLSKEWLFGSMTAPFDTLSVMAKTGWATSAASFKDAKLTKNGPFFGNFREHFSSGALWSGEGFRLSKTLLHTQVEHRLAARFGLAPSTCAWLSLLVVYPLEVFQTLAQSQAMRADENVVGVSRRIFASAGVRGFYAGLFPWMLQFTALIKAAQYTEHSSLFERIEQRVRRLFTGDAVPGAKPIQEMAASLSMILLKACAVWVVVTPFKTVAVRAQTAPLREGSEALWGVVALVKSPRSLYSGFGSDILFYLAQIIAGGVMS